VGLETIIEGLKTLTAKIQKDLSKCFTNKSASQRVRTGTIKLAKDAKVFRKESVLKARRDYAAKKLKEAEEKACK